MKKPNPHAATKRRLKRFGAFVQKQREAVGLAQFEFAELAGLSKGYASKVESGAIPSPPSEEMLERMAKALELPVDVVICEAGRVPAAVAEYVTSSPKILGKLRRALAEESAPAAE